MVRQSEFKVTDYNFALNNQAYFQIKVSLVIIYHILTDSVQAVYRNILRYLKSLKTA